MQLDEALDGVEAVRGAAATAALQTVREVHRETEAAIADPIPAPAENRGAAPAPAPEQGTITRPDDGLTATQPITVSAVDLAELGVAGRLGLDTGGDEEVGPVS